LGAFLVGAVAGRFAIDGAQRALLVGSSIDVPFMKYHVIAMASGQCLASFFCVWTVHHDCDQSGMLARTLRGAMQNGITMNMFFHAEHHLFPCVPTCHLGLLAERLDHVAPEIKQTRVF
jgi:fatty acid desaturase